MFTKKNMFSMFFDCQKLHFNVGHPVVTYSDVVFSTHYSVFILKTIFAIQKTCNRIKFQYFNIILTSPKNVFRTMTAQAIGIFRS